MAQRFNYINNRNHRFVLFRQIITTTDHFYRDKRTDTVVHSHQPGSLHQCQTVLHRMETSFSSVCHPMFHIEIVFPTELLPKVLLLPWKD